MTEDRVPRTQAGRDMVAWQAGINGFDRAYWDRRVVEIEDQAAEQPAPPLTENEAHLLLSLVNERSKQAERDGVDNGDLYVRLVNKLLAHREGPRRGWAQTSEQAPPPPLDVVSALERLLSVFERMDRDDYYLLGMKPTSRVLVESRAALAAARRGSASISACLHCGSPEHIRESARVRLGSDPSRSEQ